MAKGQLSTAEKLASKNPAQRRAGQREAAAMSSSKRSKTVSKAKNISKRGYRGTVSPSEVKGPTETQIQSAKKAPEPTTPTVSTPKVDVKRQEAESYLATYGTQGSPTVGRPRLQTTMTPVGNRVTQTSRKLTFEEKAARKSKSLAKYGPGPLGQVWGARVGIGAVAGVVSVGKAIASPLDTAGQAWKGVKAVASDPFTVLPAAAKSGWKAVVADPFYQFGKVGAEFGTTAGVVGVARKGVQVAKSAATKIKPSYLPVTPKAADAVSTIPKSAQAGKITLPSGKELEVIKPGYIPKESIPKQVARAGKEATPTSAGQRIYGPFKGDVTVKTGGEVKELGMFFDPVGRVRTSRLALQEPAVASVKDVLSGNIGLRGSKPQVVVAEGARVAPFPAALKGVESKLKKGTPLTPKEQSGLLKWQGTPTGEFKPIGFTSKTEMELTLAPGEILKKRSKLGTTVIEGKSVDIIGVEVAKPTPRTTELLGKAKLTRKQTDELAGLLGKETKLSKSYYVSPKPYVPLSSGLKYAAPFLTTSGFPSPSPAGYKAYGSPTSFPGIPKPSGYSPSRPVSRMSPIPSSFPPPSRSSGGSGRSRPPSPPPSLPPSSPPSSPVSLSPPSSAPPSSPAISPGLPFSPPPVSRPSLSDGGYRPLRRRRIRLFRPPAARYKPSLAGLTTRITIPKAPKAVTGLGIRYAVEPKKKKKKKKKKGKKR